ncbi:MAG: hypothetical protein R3C10_03750 [Pirellulales bacterium]
MLSWRPSPVPELGNVTATAILGWYAWHTASRTIPGLIRDFRDDVRTERAEHLAELVAFREEMASEREQRHRDHMVIVDVLGALSSQLRHPASSVPNHDPSTAYTPLEK